MATAFTKALGDPKEFLDNLPMLAEQFSHEVGSQHYDLSQIRDAVKKKNYDILNDPNFCRRVFAAFAVILVDWYGQRLHLRGFFKRRIVVRSKGFSTDFLDLFYRCVFEGLDLAPPGEGLPTK
jgi:hypothetical protein